MQCPKCGSDSGRGGTIYPAGTMDWKIRTYRCKGCGYRFGESPLTGEGICRTFAVGGVPVGPVIAVAEIGYQDWRSETFPTLRRALTDLVGKRVRGADIFVWGDIIPGNNLIEQIQTFNRWHQENKYYRIILYPDQTFKVYRPNEKGDH